MVPPRRISSPPAQPRSHARVLPRQLYADKAALENRTKVRLLAIRERELTLYTNNCRTIGTVAAVMAGLAQSALVRAFWGRRHSQIPRAATCAQARTHPLELPRASLAADLHKDALLSGGWPLCAGATAGPAASARSPVSPR